MPRPKSPDSREVTLATRVSKVTAATVDAKRGTATRSEWLEALVYAALADGMSPKEIQRRANGATPLPSAPPPPDVVEDAIVPLEGARRRRVAKRPGSAAIKEVQELAKAAGPHAPAASVFQEPGGEAEVGFAPEVPAGRKNCKHPNFRGVKGVCSDCREWVAK